MIARLIYLFIAVASALLLGLGMYFQYTLGLRPCAPLVLIRYALVLAGLVAVLALAINAGRIFRIVMSAVIGVLAVVGAVLAAHQSWPRYVPIDLAKLGIDVDAVIRAMPLADVLPGFFAGSGGCGQARWKILGVDGPEWAFAAFLVFIVAAFVAARRR